MPLDGLSLADAPPSGPSRSASKPRQIGTGTQHRDWHFQIFGLHDRYLLSPARGYTPPPEANIHTHRKMAQTLGIERMVIVNPTPMARITNAQSIRSKFLAGSERRW